ncbi:sugar phosphate isomerase/epimerase family protein [Actinoplanes friuliensis]|uniref:Xylose isomerase domain-containing protein TIM barrel n=1 Tax=Actinoplanes friuliensis DSM 7358 TaxID=1246995 RepID=U5W115_9ACTN|nr:sugar phosphate isomerase/epimerase family protein [Actinoplanes friuliensis]AGZ41645.1 xylose isomerase domain-containing protein TIM barrel [Actinoplanes friuliensis DSM 7358]
MWTLSGFIDEISPDFTEQCRTAADLGLKYVELRSAWEVNILDLEPARLGVMKETLEAYDLEVSSIGSPIGKIFIDEDFPAHLDRMRHAADVAHLFGAPYIRIFSFFLRPGADPAAHRDEVIRRMRALARVAEESDLVLLHENEKEIYGDVPSRCLDIVRSVDSPHLRLAWDPANFVQVGVQPYSEGYAVLRPHVEYIQIKDARAADGSVVPAGEGDGEVARTMRALHHDGFDGFFSLEPHLSAGTAAGGFSGPDLFRTAWQAFTDLLKAEGIEYA